MPKRSLHESIMISLGGLQAIRASPQGYVYVYVSTSDPEICVDVVIHCPTQKNQHMTSRDSRLPLSSPDQSRHVQTRLPSRESANSSPGRTGCEIESGGST